MNLRDEFFAIEQRRRLMMHVKAAVSAAVFVAAYVAFLLWCFS